MNDPAPSPTAERGYPLGERVLVLAVALAAFGYFLFRVFRPWDPWPEETSWPRVGEATCVGLFLLWAVGFVLWPRFFGGRPARQPEAGFSGRPVPPEDGAPRDQHG
jgi:hypothetical protein